MSVRSNDNNFAYGNLPASFAFESSRDSFSLDKVEKACQRWMETFLEDFKPSEIKKYTIEQLYQEDVENSIEEVKTMQAVYQTL